MSKEIPKRDKAQIEAAADLLLYPGQGGFAIWVRRDECLPRSAARLRGEDMPLEECCALLAAMQIALAKLTMSMAKQLDLDEEVFAGMCDKAVEVLGPRMDQMTEVKQGFKERKP